MIDIYINSGEWGGVDVVVARFADHLRSVGTDFKIIDRSGSRLREQIPWAKFITDEDARATKSSATAVFFPSVAKLRDPLVPWSHFRPDAVAFSWVVHPNDVAYAFMPFAYGTIQRFGPRLYTPLRLLQLGHYRLMQATFREFLDSRGIAVMDGATTRSLQYFYNIGASPPVIPIPSPVARDIPVRKERVSGSLVVGYLGRLESFKWSALKPFILRELAPRVTSLKVSLIAVSEGGYANELRTMCKDLGINLEITGFLSNQEARRKLVEEADLAVAMGTSALDLAAEGLPCVFIDPSIRMQIGPQETYRFVHETDDFTLGEFRDFPTYRATGRSFEAVLRELETGDVGQKGRDYVCVNHDPTQIFQQLRSSILSSELSISSLESSTRAINRSFSKNASLLGRPIQLKRYMQMRFSQG